MYPSQKETSGYKPEVSQGFPRGAGTNYFEVLFFRGMLEVPDLHRLIGG
jgi:hypothetical protein